MNTLAEQIRMAEQELKSPDEEPLFTVMPANSWVDQAKKRPIPRMLFDTFWFEDEVGILFADTNQGKSILGVQIADSIARGVAIPGFRLQAGPQAVIYFDFELSDKQFEARYSEDFKNHYRFDDKFLRAEINPESSPETFEARIVSQLEQTIIKNGSRILIIDNLTYLRNDTERAKDALPLMKELKRLKKQFKLSILCLAHTPKRDLSKPITRNDLQGSKMLINFCDSAFAIGESQLDKSTKYIKQIKVRNAEHQYDSNNVIITQICKTNSFLQFEFMGFGNEMDHLRVVSKEESDNKITIAQRMRANGKTNIEIGRHFGVSEGAVRKWLKKSDQCVVVPVVPIEPGADSTSGTVQNDCPF